MACLPQLGSVPAAYAVVAGGCDWPLPPAVGVSNNDVIVLRALRQYVSCVTFLTSLASLTSVPSRPLRSLRCVRCVALDGNPA